MWCPVPRERGMRGLRLELRTSCRFDDESGWVGRWKCESVEALEAWYLLVIKCSESSTFTAESGQKSFSLNDG